MEQGFQCPQCGKALTFLPHHSRWFCDSCNMYFIHQPDSMPNYHPPKDPSKTIALWIIVIVICMAIVLSIFIIGMLYFMISPGVREFEPTPTGALSFTESTSESGTYSGYFVSLSEFVDIEDVYLIITDDSMGQSLTMNSLEDGGTVQVPGGMSCTYSDVNGNGKMDGPDRFTVHNTQHGDVIKIVYGPTGGVIAQYAFV